MNSMLVRFCLAVFFLGAPPAGSAASKSFFEHQAESIGGKAVKMSEYKGQVVLVVNTASRCGFTGQYKDLQSLYEKYKSRGFVVVAFPSNDFAAQEPGSNSDIKKFCDLNYKVRFPMMAKGKVIGPDKQPVYRFLVENSPVKGEVSWNFEKFLVDRQGRVVGRFDPAVSPGDPKLVTQLETLLAARK